MLAIIKGMTKVVSQLLEGGANTDLQNMVNMYCNDDECNTYFVCPSVCYHVFCHHVQQTGKIATATIQRYTGSIFKIVIFIKVPRSEVMAWKPSEQANC